MYQDWFSVVRFFKNSTVCLEYSRPLNGSLLDTLHFVFTMNMVYCFFRQLLGDIGASWNVVWYVCEVFPVILLKLTFCRSLRV
jgi:hypothetical protein